MGERSAYLLKLCLWYSKVGLVFYSKYHGEIITKIGKIREVWRVMWYNKNQSTILLTP
jgi:hypothetical protein